MIIWRGRMPTCEEQVANACDSFVDLAPVTEIPAALTRSNWSAVLPGQEIPLIWERVDGREEEPC